VKRGNHQGSITKLRSGRFWVRITHPDKTREPLGTYRTKEEAESVLNGALELLAAGQAAPAHTTSLLTFEDKFFRLRALRARDKKAVREKNRYKVHLRTAPFAARPMGSVSTPEAQRWVDSLPSKGLAHETIKRIVQLARSVWRYACKDGLCERNPFTRDIELPAVDELLDEPWDFLRPAEQSAMLTCGFLPEPPVLWFAFAMGSGLRPSEHKRLLLDEVDVYGENPCIRVRKTKTNRPRTVPLFGLALSAARRWLELLPTFCPRNKRGLFWPRPRGGLRSGIGLPRPNDAAGEQQYEHAVWRGWLRAAGIERDLRWYDATRHTCATSLLCGFWGKRWELVDVQAVLGHKSIATTQRYAHVADETLQNAGKATMAAELAAAVVWGNTNTGYGVGDGQSSQCSFSEQSRYARPDSNGRLSDSKSDALSS